MADWILTNNRSQTSRQDCHSVWAPRNQQDDLNQIRSFGPRLEYVELHSSHFDAGGLPNVQRTFEEFFTKLIELDQCVVLFDEIDELMRERETVPDAFGRFLTTSMLP